MHILQGDGPLDVLAEVAIQLADDELNGDDDGADALLLPRSEEDVDREIQQLIRVRSVSTARPSTAEFIAVQQELPTFQAPVETEEEVELFYQLLPRFIPKRDTNNMNFEEFAKAFNEHVCDEYIRTLETVQGEGRPPCSRSCCRPVSGNKSSLVCMIVANKMHLRLKTTQNIKQYADKHSQHLKSNEAIVNKLPEMRNLSLALKNTLGGSVPPPQRLPRPQPSAQEGGASVQGGAAAAGTAGGGRGAGGAAAAAALLPLIGGASLSLQPNTLGQQAASLFPVQESGNMDCSSEMEWRERAAAALEAAKGATSFGGAELRDEIERYAKQAGFDIKQVLPLRQPHCQALRMWLLRRRKPG